MSRFFLIIYIFSCCWILINYACVFCLNCFNENELKGFLKDYFVVKTRLKALLINDYNIQFFVSLLKD